MRKTALILATVCLCFAGVASADSATYVISVNPSSIAGTSGSLDFQFNPGAMSQAADVQVLGFTSDGSLGAAATTGDVSGTLPGTVSFDNGTVFNDYFTGFTYGNTLTFDVNLFGPALTSPRGFFHSSSSRLVGAPSKSSAPRSRSRTISRPSNSIESKSGIDVGLPVTAT